MYLYIYFIYMWNKWEKTGLKKGEIQNWYDEMLSLYFHDYQLEADGVV